MMNKIDKEALAQAAGGSAQEMAELKAAIHGNPRLKSIWDQYMDELENNEFEATACTVTDALGIGFTASKDSSPNIYDDGYTHEEVLGRLYNYRK